MEVIIAILWYLSVFTLNTEYTMDEFDSAYQANEAEVTTIQADDALVGNILNDYDGSISVIEEMPDEEADPDGWYRKKF